MRKINYPLIVSDFDGTLVNADGTVTEKNRKAIAEYTEAGGKFVISTGRLPSGILPRAKELGLKGLISCCQGAIVLDVESGKTLLEGRLSFENTLKACREMEKYGLHIHAYDSWDYYANVDDEPLRLYESIVKSKAQRILDKPLSQFLEERGIAAYKLLAMVEPERNDGLLKALQEKRIEGCEITKSAAFLLEICSSDYSKGTAVEFLANYYGVPVEKTVAVGDELNDLSMIERAGVGVAVKNAVATLKERADYVCEYTNEESAIAKIIDKFGFYEEKKV